MEHNTTELFVAVEINGMDEVTLIGVFNDMDRARQACIDRCTEEHDGVTINNLFWHYDASHNYHYIDDESGNLNDVYRIRAVKVDDRIDW